MKTAQQLKPFSVPGRILRKALIGSILPLLHGDIVAEYDSVLRRKKFLISTDAIETLIMQLSRRGVFLDAADISDYVSDPKEMGELILWQFLAKPYAISSSA